MLGSGRFSLALDGHIIQVRYNIINIETAGINAHFIRLHSNSFL